ncbi:MAG: hypothetical protein VR73_01400 [Gammaproteobacteria bacterium BRH_c0]|nr:MAG: hypothetical protein VR73_01400 [Gammaproteobacteria bacterium BRH_c0]
MQPEQRRRNPAFTLLPEEPAARHKAPASASLPAISRTGINIYFPARPCQDYLNLLVQEMLLKDKIFSSKGPVASLWLRGYPLRQLTTDAMTELVFRLCSHYNLQNNLGAERGIELGPEHCDRNILALLKGLGFEVIRLMPDATLASADRSTDAVRRAMDVANEFAGLRLQWAVQLGADTDQAYLDKLLSLLMSSATEEIELIPCPPALQSIDDALLCQKITARAAQQLIDQGFQRFGEHCFKLPPHPDLLLRDNRNLCYGPWGFYKRDIVNWLGLGLGAEGIWGDYLYHNSGNPDCYRHRILNHQDPVAGWSCAPLADQQSYRVMQELYCYHSLGLIADSIGETSRARLVARGWLVPDGAQLRLTTAGVENLASVFRSILCKDNVLQRQW